MMRWSTRKRVEMMRRGRNGEMEHKEICRNDEKRVGNGEMEHKEKGGNEGKRKE